MESLRELTCTEDWTEVWSESDQIPVLLIKHSTTCPISANAWREFQLHLTQEAIPDVSYVFVKVIESRPVSLQIASDLGVPHKSPQVILIVQQQARWSLSHWDITAQNINSALLSHPSA
ncbi:bacillithiol system redox-active protein YtxJ [Alicyclobacillaceae bacterium I2511]|nr:bacillithiol system redox-active protein YtxJ [Alicyclobacillaceae bacterium I2511]